MSQKRRDQPAFGSRYREDDAGFPEIVEGNKTLPSILIKQTHLARLNYLYR